MEFLNVIAAAVAAFAFGAVWYIGMSKPWMAASGVTEDQQKAGGPMPFVVGLLAMVLVAGMMRHMLGTCGRDERGRRGDCRIRDRGLPDYALGRDELCLQRCANPR